MASSQTYGARDLKATIVEIGYYFLFPWSDPHVVRFHSLILTPPGVIPPEQPSVEPFNGTPAGRGAIAEAEGPHVIV